MTKSDDAILRLPRDVRNELEAARDKLIRLQSAGVLSGHDTCLAYFNSLVCVRCEEWDLETVDGRRQTCRSCGHVYYRVNTDDQAAFARGLSLAAVMAYAVESLNTRLNDKLLKEGLTTVDKLLPKKKK